MKLGMAQPWVLSTPSSGGRSVSLRDQLALPSLSCPFASGPVRRSLGHRASQTYLPAARWKSLQLRPPIAHAESRLQLPTCRLRKNSLLSLQNLRSQSAMEFLQSPTFFPLSRTAVAQIGEALSTLTHPLTHAKWRQRADIAIPFQISLTSMRRLDARKASTGSCPSKPP